MDGSVPDLRLQVAALLAGTIDLNQFQDWFIMNETAIEQRGSDEDIDFLDDVYADCRIRHSPRDSFAAFPCPRAANADKRTQIGNA